jgi:hypothetical protein
LELTQRAWISPVAATLLRKLEKDRGILFGIDVINSGREPAVGVKMYIHNDTIESFDPQFADVTEITVPENTSCDLGIPERGASIVAPTAPGMFNLLAKDTNYGIPQFHVDDRILNGTRFYVVNGCVVYLTYNKPHHSKFCYILQSEVVDNVPKFKFATCGRNWDAD